MSKLVFLDIDGVLNALETREPPSRYHAGLFLNPVLVARVGQICERTGASVVLSTSWRNRCNYPAGHSMHLPQADLYAAIYEAGLAGFRASIVGVTPDLSRQDSITRDGEVTPLWRCPPRHKEIALYVEQHKPEAWVILDDDQDAGIADHFVHVDRRRGISQADVETAVRILGG